MPVTETHVEKRTLQLSINLPGHDERITTPLFTRSREAMLKMIGNRCEVTGQTPEEGGPIELHHLFVERCLATEVDPVRLHNWLRILHLRTEAALQWFATQLQDGKTYEDIWADPYLFTDDMMVNGLGLCKRVHTGVGEGIHYLPFPDWQLWAYGKPGFDFVGADCIKDEQEAAERAEAESEISHNAPGTTFVGPDGDERVNLQA